jgi:hypothetical protein
MWAGEANLSPVPENDKNKGSFLAWREACIRRDPQVGDLVTVPVSVARAYLQIPQRPCPGLRLGC